ncbi:MAG: hypothetical protein ACE5HQ_11830, partial [Gemmatimonadota bacterium]
GRGRDPLQGGRHRVGSGPAHGRAGDPLRQNGVYEPVERQIDAEHPAWFLWTHTWRPREPGVYPIRLRVNDEAVRTRRLDWGYYTWRVRIGE